MEFVRLKPMVQSFRLMMNQMVWLVTSFMELFVITAAIFGYQPIMGLVNSTLKQKYLKILLKKKGYKTMLSFRSRFLKLAKGNYILVVLMVLTLFYPIA